MLLEGLLSGEVPDSPAIGRLLAREAQVGKLALEEYENSQDWVIAFIVNYWPISDMREILRAHESMSEEISIDNGGTSFRELLDMLIVESARTGFLLGFARAYRKLGMLEVPADPGEVH